MKTKLMMAAAMVVTLQARQIEHAVDQMVVVYFENSLAPTDEFMATNLADKMFAKAGVRIVWRAGAPSAQKIAEERPVVIRFATNTAAPGALAFAAPYEGVHVTIFSDRVQMGDRRATQAVLAHVLVHEITHILQGFVRHSESGIMRAQWTSQDYADMVWRPLSFTADDIRLIHSGLVVRAARKS